jgi:hypothetical protein
VLPLRCKRCPLVGVRPSRVDSPLTRTSGAPPANNFPPFINRLIGRAAAAQFVRDLVSAYRVVTLTGPGGIGKTVFRH